ncbi:DUF5667 domain-containing protein [Frankia sp. AgB32]|uniref:DUF5667 domain-containing protein n=1 Tax=Frankia sp. AgB32 TaxID=631119 RepID=UPI0027E2BF0B|nr:DUF5667 domain-containing protein [Frankia sp. AgB32]
MRTARGRDRDGDARPRRTGRGRAAARWWRPRRARADHLQTVLDGAREPANADEDRLLSLTAALSELPLPRMDPTRRAAVRARLLASLAEPAPPPSTSAAPATAAPAAPASPAGVATGRSAHAPGRPWSGSGRRVRREAPGHARLPLVARAVLAAGLSAVITMVGLAMSAANALPGEPLYSVKRQVENFQVALRRDPVERAKTRLTVAGTRMDELHTVTGTGSAPSEPAGAGPATAGSPQPSTERAPGQAPVPVPNGPPTPQGAPAVGGAAPGPASWLPLGLPFAAPAPGLPATTAGPWPTTTTDRAMPAPDPTGRPPAAAGQHTDPDAVNGLLRSWCAQAGAGSQVLLARASAGDADAWRTMNTFTTTQASRLATVLSVLPAGTTESAQAAMQLIDQFRVTLDAHTPPPAPSAPRSTPARPSESTTTTTAPGTATSPPPAPDDAADHATATPSRAAPAAEGSPEVHGLPATRSPDADGDLFAARPTPSTDATADPDAVPPADPDTTPAPSPAAGPPPPTAHTPTPAAADDAVPTDDTSPTDDTVASDNPSIDGRSTSATVTAGNPTTDPTSTTTDQVPAGTVTPGPAAPDLVAPDLVAPDLPATEAMAPDPRRA